MGEPDVGVKGPDSGLTSMQPSGSHAARFMRPSLPMPQHVWQSPLSQEHLEDADASQVKGDAVTDREVLEGRGGTPATTGT